MQIPKIFWRRISLHPFLSPYKDSVAPDAVTTPDILMRSGTMVSYVGGVQAGRERIISLSLQDADLEKSTGEIMRSARVVLEAGPDDYDCYHVYDPASVAINEKIYLFYSAIGKGPDSIGLAVSDMGREFIKGDHPILTGRSPESVYDNGKLYLYYVLKDQLDGYRIFGSVSSDCDAFHSLSNKPLLDSGLDGSWDYYEVTTPRIFFHNGTYYMVYAASRSSERKDMPEAFGLARSVDLVNWEKYPHNPVFVLGSAGSWDDGAIWFGTVFERNNSLYMIYEGGRLTDILGHSPALTQVGLAKLPLAEFDCAISDW